MSFIGSPPEFNRMQCAVVLLFGSILATQRQSIVKRRFDGGAVRGY
jgi:hypothetical protein